MTGRDAKSSEFHPSAAHATAGSYGLNSTTTKHTSLQWEPNRLLRLYTLI